ncbi:hypothetical protein [Limobrevibacterium gyesilva]|uniref:Uncharacterized protein n=1 Tax=Limobrevibacterium gyesilva TaxID=2991712 RepID=A0AA42CHM4_9PROT|nr:hypothetical protein [Limobrevibacterium gyesilva]MCW3475025.1 hypothetical protein [Limobrevibacterium gyesilva]
MARAPGTLALTVLLAVSACSRETPDSRTPNLSSGASLSALIGAGEVELVQRLGQPTRSFDTAGLRYVVYERTDIWQMRMRLPATFTCRTTFILDAGHVRSFDRTGIGCA